MLKETRPSILSPDQQTIRSHWHRADLAKAVLDDLTAQGKDLTNLTLDDLAALDQFHGGGKEMTMRLARAAGFKSGTRVLDLGAGLGGPARTLAVEFGCQVTAMDLTESYVEVGRVLTRLLKLEDRVTHVRGDALQPPFQTGSFDAVWTQNSGMNIEAKEKLYEGIRRVLRPGGILAIQEPMAGPTQPIVFPVMWADDASTSFLRSPLEMRSVIESVGFQNRSWEDVTTDLRNYRRSPEELQHSIQHLVMGDKLSRIIEVSPQNTDQGRIVMVQAVFDLP